MTIISFASLMAKVFRSQPAKKVKRYPTMVVSSPKDIAAWNAKVEAGKISRKGHRVA